MTVADAIRIDTQTMLENAADTCYAEHDSDDERTQKWSVLAHFAAVAAYELMRITRAGVELCEAAASEYVSYLEDRPSEVDRIDSWMFQRQARRLSDELSIAFARHHGGRRDGRRVCECAECDALEAARDLAGWIGLEMPRRVNHWSFDSYAGLIATRDCDHWAEEWWRGQMALAGAPVACSEEWAEDERQAA